MNTTIVVWRQDTPGVYALDMYGRAWASYSGGDDTLCMICGAVLRNGWRSPETATEPAQYVCAAHVTAYSADLPRTADGYPQPLEPGQYAPGDWGCALWHVWPAAAFAGAHNTHSHAPGCPVCAYPLWRIWTIDADGYVYIQGRDPEPEPEPLEQPAQGTAKGEE